jgi:hypothetical protein
MQEIRQRFGEPRHQGSAIENEKAVKTFAYSYASGAGGLVGGVIPARAMNYFFYNDILVGYQFVSSFPEDRTDFSEAALDRIKKGTTEEREVIDLLGTPTGRYIYPIADRDGAAFGYAYTETRGPTLNIRLYRKTLRISFDPNGIVTNVKFYSFGNVIPQSSFMPALHRSVSVRQHQRQDLLRSCRGSP